MNTRIALTAMASLWLSAAAYAEEPASPLSANVSLTTNYKFRGQDQGENKPAIQGGFDYAKDGFYIGNWNSSIGFTNAGIEMDFYGGYKGEFSPGLSYDVGILQYYYPQRNRTVNFNTTEIYGGIGFGPASLKYFHTVSKDYFGFGFGSGVDSGRNTGYLDLSANVAIAPSLTLNGHVGYTRFASDLRNNLSIPNYYDYKVGVTYDLGSGFAVAGAVVGANKRGYFGDINKTRFIATLTKAL